jgi:hypothetical protein
MSVDANSYAILTGDMPTDLCVGCGKPKEKERDGLWWCGSCYTKKEAAYAEARRLGITNRNEIMEMVQKYISCGSDMEKQCS